MKIIHTSDWHIGQTLYQYSREEEHEFFFEQLKSIIINEKPDALVVSGDIFHSATPTVISQRLYYHTLVELSRLYEDLQIIVVAGNHDSPSRLDPTSHSGSQFTFPRLAFALTQLRPASLSQSRTKHSFSMQTVLIHPVPKKFLLTLPWDVSAHPKISQAPCSGSAITTLPAL